MSSLIFLICDDHMHQVITTSILRFWKIPLKTKKPQNITFLGHLSHSGDLSLWVDGRRRQSCIVLRALCVGRCASCVVRRALTSTQELLGQSWPKLVCSICRKRRQEFINFMAPAPREHNFGVKSVKFMYFLKHLVYSGVWSIQSHILKMHNFFKNLLLYSIEQTN